MSPSSAAAFRRSARIRILGWFVAIIALAIGGSLVVERQVLLLRLAHRVDTQQSADAAALGREAQQGGPRTVAGLFSSYLHSHVPAPGTEFLALVGGRPDAEAGSGYPLERLSALVHAARSVHHAVRGTLSSPQGPMRYLAVPVTQPGSVPGVFVDATFTRSMVGEANGDVTVAAVVSLTTLLVMTLIAWAVAGRVLAPVRTMTDAAVSITDTDLGRRIESAGSDEISQLAGAFNSMLDRLQSAFESQAQFVSDAGHELRTPITVIRGHLELLGDDPEERAETMGIVNDELDRMSRMVDDLLLLAKAERPDFLRLAPLRLADFVPELLAKATTLAERRWVADVPPGCSEVVADRQRLTQAIMNLADNAAAHTGPEDTIRIGYEIGGGDYRIWVADTGSGIPAQDQERIFERFARGRNERRRAQGAGLGLAIVKAIAEAHRGSLELASQLGQGSTFTLTLPVSPVEHHLPPTNQRELPWPGS